MRRLSTDRNGVSRQLPSDPRAMAWEILRRVEEEGAYADALLGHAPDAHTLAVRDRALLTRLVYSTLAWQGYLDHVLAAFCRRPPAEIDAPVRTLLRLTLCQICVLTKIPPFAAVNTAVDLAKRFRGGAAAGLVNAVLRRAATSWQDVQFPSRQEDPIGYLSSRLSHPRWLVERWLAQYGLDEAEAMLRANNEAAPTALRVNRLRGDPTTLLEEWRRTGRVAEASRYSPVGIRVADGGAAEAMPGYAAGMFSVQGEASQLVGFMTGAQAGERILDVCAAPGGKATHLAELMDDRGELVAIDVSARGIERLARMAQRLGLSILHPAVADATTWHPPDGKFDRVLLDAPCSGLGTLRQHPEIRWRRTPEDIASLVALQRQLLLRAAEWVRPGGVLVYATCTVGTEENDEVIGRFLHERPSFLVDDPRPFLPAPARELVGSDDALRTFPHPHGLDGFFAVRLKARG
ncbi:MAG: 16S rRNA (cytosine(967)-C(5))-methyltransferase RsmB [Candidatus Binatia bacterium]